MREGWSCSKLKLGGSWRSRRSRNLVLMRLVLLQVLSWLLLLMVLLLLLVVHVVLVVGGSPESSVSCLSWMT